MISKVIIENEFFDELVEVARKSTCHRSKCGSIIVKDGKIIGVGYNSQPCNIFYLVNSRVIRLVVFMLSKGPSLMRLEEMEIW